MKDFKLTKANLESVEQVSGKLSDKYVPIKTSELVKALEPEYQFTDGYRFAGNGSTRHYVDLKSDDTTIRIYNSFDGSLALRAYITSGGLQFSLFKDTRVIHRGQGALEVYNVQEVKEQILNAVPVAQEMINKLSTMDVTEEIQEIVNEAVFKEQKARIKYDAEFVNYVDEAKKMLEENGKTMSTYAYINRTINNYLKGDYGVKYKDKNTLRAGRPIKSPYSRITLVSVVEKALTEKMPEYFI
jgi:hypothetical protein